MDGSAGSLSEASPLQVRPPASNQVSITEIGAAAAPALERKASRRQLAPRFIAVGVLVPALPHTQSGLWTLPWPARNPRYRERRQASLGSNKLLFIPLPLFSWNRDICPLAWTWRQARPLSRSTPPIRAPSAPGSLFCNWPIAPLLSPA